MDVVTKLCQPYHNTNRTIIMDNFFTTYELSQHLKANKLSCVGTVRKNKRFIPREFLANKRREVFSSLFGFRANTTLVSYVPKKNKSVILLSTLHHNVSVDLQNENKPHIICFYNATKGGVDVMDQLCHEYTVQRSTNRWPNAYFFNLINA